MASEFPETTVAFLDGGIDRPLALKAITNQVKLLCDRPLKGKGLSGHLLEYLAWLKLRSQKTIFGEPLKCDPQFANWCHLHQLPTEAEEKKFLPADTGGRLARRVFAAFYCWAVARNHIDTRDEGGGRTTNAGTHLANGLRDNLARYYERERPGEIIISIRDAVGGHQPDFQCPSNLSANHASTGSEPMVYSKWDKNIFDGLLGEAEAGNDGNPDVRIISSLFDNSDVPGLDKPLSRGCRIEILIMDPDVEDLVRARYKLRHDFARGDRSPVQTALDDLRSQIADLPHLPKRLGGAVVVRVSDVMPCGFLAITRKQAILGTMLAVNPHDRGGPMVVATPENKQLWSLLESDWEARWKDSKTPTEAAEAAKLRNREPRKVSDWLVDSVAELRRNPWHHYHATKTPGNDRVWVYSKIDFSKDPALGYVRASVSSPFRGNGTNSGYRLRGDRIGAGLILRHDVEKPSENLTFTAFFPVFEDCRPAYGLGFLKNFKADMEFVPCLISEHALLGIEEEGLLSGDKSDELEAIWDRMSTAPVVRPHLQCHYRGNSQVALVKAFAEPTRLLHIWDTHAVLANTERLFDTPQSLSFKDHIKTFLNTPGTFYKLVVGVQQDQDYIQMLIDCIQALANSRNFVAVATKKIECRQLRPGAEVTRFTILHYRNAPAEAVFGWGRPSAAGKLSKVYSSTDEALVREFEAAFGNLCRDDMSMKVDDIRTLIAPRQSNGSSS